jgi:dolichyl-phosphate beta-glucosyltransferase
MDARRNLRIDAPISSGPGVAVDARGVDDVSNGSRGHRRRTHLESETLSSTAASDCVIVIPCYNERRRLNADAFREFLLDHENIGFLFVNDGSTDGTRELLDELALGSPERLRAMHLERNGGKAEAVRRGLLEAAGLGVRYAGFWDADLATPLDAIPEFVGHLDVHPDVQMIFGSRVRLLGRQIDRRLVRHYLGRIFATTASLVLGVPLYDTQCGAKLFRVSPEIVRLFETPFRSRWIFDVEIVARFLCEPHSAGIDSLIHEEPLQRWRDVAGSKVRPRDFVRALFELWTIGRVYRRGGQGAPAPGARDGAQVVAARASSSPSTTRMNTAEAGHR